jgi:Concanavalin A-like lectin/glucanases superfamily
MKKIVLFFIISAILWGACKKDGNTPTTTKTIITPPDSTKDTTAVLPPINGYDSSNAIAPSNLLAHWTFENTMTELLSATAPTTTTGITYTTGVNNTGKAAYLSNGYAVYPTIAALSSSSSLFSNGFTISVWVKVANNGSTISNLVALSSPIDSQTDWNDGPIEMYVETGQHPSGNDTITLHSALSTYIPGSGFYHADNLNAYGTPGSDFYYVTASDTTWIHYVAEYNAATSFLQIYANGKLVSNTAFQYRTNGSSGLGAMNILTPTQVILGSFANSTVGFTSDPIQSWQGLFTGTMDNLRVYNTPLDTAAISALYQLELAGR